MRMGPGVAVVVAAANDDRAILLRRAQQVDGAAVCEQVAPERTGHMGDVRPGTTIVQRAVDAGQVLLALVVQRAAGPKIVVRGQQRARAEPHDAGAAEVGLGGGGPGSEAR